MGVFSKTNTAEPVDFEKWEAEGTRAIRVRHDNKKRAISARDGEDFCKRIARGETMEPGLSESANAACNQVTRDEARELANFVEAKMGMITAEHERLLREAMVAAPTINRLRAFETNMTRFLHDAGQPLRRTAVVAEGPLLAQVADFERRAESILNPPPASQPVSRPPLQPVSFADLVG